MTRKTQVQSWVLALLVIALALLGTTQAFAARTDLFFIESDEDLTATFEAVEKGELGSIAILQDYFEGSPLKTKMRMRALIEFTFHLKDRTVYIYSANLDRPPAEAMLGMDKPSFCPKPYFIGKRIEAKSTDPVLHCGIVGPAAEMSPEFMRKHILRNHRSEEKLIPPPGSHAA